jgi:hypothetical protein
MVVTTPVIKAIKETTASHVVEHVAGRIVPFGPLNCETADKIVQVGHIDAVFYVFSWIVLHRKDAADMLQGREIDLL